VSGRRESTKLQPAEKFQVPITKPEVWAGGGGKLRRRKRKIEGGESNGGKLFSGHEG
jgi:hypothetical protein